MSESEFKPPIQPQSAMAMLNANASMLDSNIEKVIENAFETLRSGDDIMMYSELTQYERVLFARMIIKSEIIGDGFTELFITTYLKLGVSIDRKGRREIVESLKAVASGVVDRLNMAKDIFSGNR